jgi:baculoviral IAP repeat-containing protein 6
MDAGEENVHGEDVQETMVKATSLCGDIIAARDDMERAMAVLENVASSNGLGSRSSYFEPDLSSSNFKDKGKMHGKDRDPFMEMENAYSRACERLAFKYVMLADANANGIGLNYANHNYATDLNTTQFATRNPKDRLHLVKELAVMATSLPPGVWVRVDEVRNDAM